eukprot:6460520-Ditylum_brightwellii.AAC.1
MIQTLSSLHLQNLGLPDSAAVFIVQLNKKMKNYAQSSTRESSEYYQHSEEYTKGGKGQGKTSSPPNWLFQSSTLLKSLKEQCTGLYLTSVDQKYVSKQVAEGYVDDCDARTADQQAQCTNTTEIITDKMRVIAQTWADLIYASGGE